MKEFGHFKNSANKTSEIEAEIKSAHKEEME